MLQHIQWAERNFMIFLEYQKRRNLKGEIATGTVVNYYRATKSFCEMSDLQLSGSRYQGAYLSPERPPMIEPQQLKSSAN